MDIHCRIGYHEGNETPRKPRTTPNAKGTGRRPASGRQNLSINSRDPELVDKFSGALGPSPSQGRPGSAPAQTGFRASADADAGAEAPPAAVAGKGLPVRRIFDGPVDLATHSQADRKIFRDALSSRPCVAGVAGTGLDLSEAGATSAATRRESHRALEEAGLAAYKKKPEDLGAISSSSMRAASSSSPTSARPGRRLGRLRSLSTAIDAIGFPLSPASPCPHPGNGSACTSVSTPATSPAWRLSGFCATFCGICVARWCSFGTAARFTGASLSAISSTNISGFMFIVFPPTLQNSIRMSSSGPRQSTLSPMARRRTLPRSERNYAVLSTEFAGRKNCCGPASTLPISPGLAPRYIHYFYESQ